MSKFIILLLVFVAFYAIIASATIKTHKNEIGNKLGERKVCHKCMKSFEALLNNSRNEFAIFSLKQMLQYICNLAIGFRGKCERGIDKIVDRGVAKLLSHDADYYCALLKLC